MSKIKKIGVLTGGGDCPGLNPAIKAITTKALESGVSEIIGIREGWRGLIETTSDYTMSLDAERVRHIDGLGGTILGTSRTNPIKMAGGSEKVVARLRELDLGALIAIGGEDTLGVASQLFDSHQLPVIGVPKTIDRDLPGTEYTLGFESALQVIADAVDSLRSTAESHARIFVVEIMGRHAGHLALKGAISAGADVILIPEFSFSVDRVCELLRDRHDSGIRYSIVFVAEGALPQDGTESFQSNDKDAFGHVRLGGMGEWLASQIHVRTQLECRSLNLSHLQRGGRPVAYDRRMGFYYGIAAVELILAKNFGHMVALNRGRIGPVPLARVRDPIQIVDLDSEYDTDRYRAQL